jgi:hypothetical protein
MFENERFIPVPVDKYEELVRKAEKIDAVKRFACHSKYVSVGEILTLLDIKGEEEDVTNA